MLIWNNVSVCAQFYDDEDEILFYDCTHLNDEVLNNPNSSYVFNFDGEKGTNFSQLDNGKATRKLGVETYLKENINYFEGKVFDVEYNLKYRSEMSNSSWTVYSEYNYYNHGFGGYSVTYFYYFSKDRKTMIKIKEGYEENKWIYKLVDKNYFIEKGRRRSYIDNEKIYE